LALPDLNTDGYLDEGIYLAELNEVLQRFGVGSSARERQGNLLRLIVENARKYPTIKRVLIWGSFVSAKPEPGDLDYSIVVEVRHNTTTIEPYDRRFFVPYEAHLHYGADRGFLVLKDYPPEAYAEAILFFSQDRDGKQRGILEVNCHE
jgi:hypothetical protein